MSATARPFLPVSLDTRGLILQDQKLAQAMKTFRIEAVHHFQNVLPRSFSVYARVIRNGGPLTCLSCGAKTQPDGSLPCGH